jgi:zinc and cadmium transporter
MVVAMTLYWIVLATLAGGVLSVLAAGLLSLTILARWSHRLIGFSAGVLLAAALLEILPESASNLPAHTIGALVLAGLLSFFLLEKAALWRHDHSHPESASHPSGMIILLGDGLHNFVDGLLIAAAFLQDVTLGIATTTAVVVHEIPQEIGDFMVLLAAGYSRKRALVMNAISGSMAVAGGMLGYFLLQNIQGAIPYLLALAASSFIYIAVADLMPRLQKDRKTSDFILQPAFFAFGIVVIVSGHFLH